MSFIFFSCKESDKDKITRLVKEWEGKEIHFPPRSIFTIQGKDTVDFPFEKAEYKIVTYVDSIGCISCKLQLPRWKSFIHTVDSISHVKVPFVFYFHAKTIKELRYVTRRDDFHYPICLDIKDEFNSINHLPSEMLLQTFLLDKDNKIIAMGNPVHNPKIKELYLQILEGKGNSDKPDSYTEVGIDKTSYSFGSFPYTEKKECEFILTNTGDKILAIYDIIPSCSCTEVKYDKQPVRPGGKLSIRVIYKGEEPGYFSKSVAIHCNTKDSPLRVKISGEAK